MYRLVLAVSRAAAVDVGFDHTKLSDPALNIQAGSKYLAVVVKRAGGDLQRGLLRYGGRPTYPAGRILSCEDCLNRIPDERKKCPVELARSAQECLDKIHK